jgi:predicted Rossmann fold nucleotide-binding protein DprA/Smf involved in DNA uptake
MNNNAPCMTPTTQATLLLCSYLGGSRATSVLTTREYTTLCGWLEEQRMSLADLLGPEAPDWLEKHDRGDLDAHRIADLLGRGAALAFAFESWQSRGIWVIARGDSSYPKRLMRLDDAAPPLIFGLGNHRLADAGGLAIAGSRDADRADLAFAQRVAQAAAREGIGVISGGARGVDSAAMFAAIGDGGPVVGVLANGLVKAATVAEYRQALTEGMLCLLSPYDPDAPFTIGNAMGRNRLIYVLSDWALVVRAAPESGGSWAGAEENLKKGWVTLFVRSGAGTAEGNRLLLERGGVAFPDDLMAIQSGLRRWLDDHGRRKVAGLRESDEAPRQLPLL